MFNSGAIMLGQYRPLDSFLHRLDTRAKMLPVMLTLVLALFTDSILFYVLMTALVIGGLLGSGVSGRTLWRNFKPIILLIAITGFYHLVFSGGDSQPLLEIYGWSIRSEAVQLAGYYSLRLVLFISIAFLITLTSSPSDMADALAKLLRPLEKLRLPVSDLALILFMALRFIPVLFEEFTIIKNAQMIRGVSFTGSWVSRIRKTAYIIIPVFVAAVSRADQLALAIEARGYGRHHGQSGKHRTYYSRTKIGGRDWLFMAASSSVISLLFWGLG